MSSTLLKDPKSAGFYRTHLFVLKRAPAIDDARAAFPPPLLPVLEPFLEASAALARLVRVPFTPGSRLVS